MKKFLPILTLIGCSALFVGCDAMVNTKANGLNVKDFKESVNKYSLTKPENISKTVGAYNLEIVDNINNPSPLSDSKEPSVAKDILPTVNEKVESLKTNTTNERVTDDTQTNNPNDDLSTNDSDTNISNENTNLKNDVTNEQTSQISTLYALTSDIDEKCDEFCQLKSKILDAIVESENLSNKIKNNEISLTREQRLFVNEQSAQLKNLSRQLSNATNELSFNLSDLSAIMKENNQDLDALSLKYFIVLDNLINGNEMLENGLSSLNLINNMMQINSKNIQPNNQNKILYGFQENNNEPILKEYTVNDNGELEGKIIENYKKENLENEQVSSKESKKTNIDTYQNTKLASNIETYGNNRRNIDTFFNTALLDNDFMYGNNNGYGGMYGNPNLYQYQNYEQRNEFNSSNYNNQNNSNLPKKEDKSTKRKKRKLKSNIDTYRDENTPDIKTKMKNFKSSISNFFNKTNVAPKNKITNPIYKLED